MNQDDCRELDALRSENQQLRKDLEKQTLRAENFARDGFLSDLVGNNRLSPEEFRSSCLELHVDLPSDWFAVMAIRIHTDIPFSAGDDIPDNQETLRYARFLIRNVVEDLAGEKNICHVLIVQGELVGLINLLEPPEQGLQSAAEASERAARLFEENYDTVVSFSISAAHQGYASIPAAYRETGALIDYRIMAGDDTRVLLYDQRTERNLPKERVEHFEFEHALGSCIRSGSYEEARVLVHKMLEAEFGHTQPTVQVYMIRAYGIINDILHIFDSLEEEFTPEFLVELQAGPRIVQASSLQEISQEVDGIFDAIIAKQQRGEQEPQWIQRAVNYMDSHFTDPNINVSGVADAVNINAVYFSRMLKRYRNISPLEYIHQKRIELAKQLLSSGVTVKDTLPKVGYSSALTMNRAFRRFEDTTPGTFYRDPKSS